MGNGTPRGVISRYWRAAGLLSSLQDGWDELSQACETWHLQQRVLGGRPGIAGPQPCSQRGWPAAEEAALKSSSRRGEPIDQEDIHVTVSPSSL